MTIEEVLVQAERTDWTSFDQPHSPRRQTTGTALRALLQAGPKNAFDALFDLIGTVWHQGTSYEGAATLIPLITTLAAQPGCPNRRWLLYGLTLLGGGFPEDTVNDLLIAPEKTPFAWSFPSGAAARDALNRGVGTLRNLLGDGEPPVRQLAAYSLVLCPPSAGVSSESLHESLQREQHSPTLAGGIVCLGTLNFLSGGSTGEVLLHSAATSPSYQVRAGALVGLAAMRALSPDEDQQLFGLLDGRALNEKPWEPLVFEDGYAATVDCLARGLYALRPDRRLPQPP